jgi:hypothetical protein
LASRRSGGARRREVLFGIAAATAGVGSSASSQSSRTEFFTIPDLPFPAIEVPGGRALAEWTRLKAAGRGWPVVLGGPEDVGRVTEQATIVGEKAPEETLRLAAGLKHPQALQRWRKEEDEGYEDESPVELGKWPPPETLGPSTGLSVAYDLKNQPLPKVIIVELPTRESAAAFAHLRYGGWNACPPPEIHVSVMRGWAAKYGAEVVGATGDVVNVRVARRPTSRAEALALAREQYAYCSDIVDQGVGTLSNLADTLMADDWWYFWWD